MSIKATQLLAVRPSRLQPKAHWLAWIYQALVFSVLIGLVNLVAPHAIPYGFTELWQTTGNPGQWLWTAWPILAWAFGVTFVIAALTRNSREENRYAESYLAGGVWLSLRAGIMEEIIFRWLMFMWCIAMAKLGDFILGGFIFNHGLVWLIYEYIFNPIADFFTMGMLHQQLASQSAWFIAAGLMVANANFRDGHKYQGLFGYINSWFIGMYMFYLLFHFGLVACIVVHLVYDLTIDAISYVDRVIERSGRNG